MAHKIEIVKAEYRHIARVAKNMRKADRDEVAASSGYTPRKALAFSLKKSAYSWTALIDGKPEVMFGVGDLNVLAGVGVPWLLGTDVIDDIGVQFLRLSLDFKDQLLRRYPILRNFVDVRNTASIRWLEWLGCRLLDPVDLRGHQFRLFELRSDDVRSGNNPDDRLYGPRRGRDDTASAGVGGI